MTFGELRIWERWMLKRQGINVDGLTAEDHGKGQQP
jgi:hypothetical protein